MSKAEGCVDVPPGAGLNRCVRSGPLAAALAELRAVFVPVRLILSTDSAHSSA